MCQASGGELRYGARRAYDEARQALQILIDRSDRGDQPTKAEWSDAMARAIIAEDHL